MHEFEIGPWMSGFTYDSVGQELLLRLPELSASYGNEQAWWRDTPVPPHVLIGDVFAPYSREVAEDPAKTEEFERAAAFLETMATHEDEEVQKLAAYSVCEGLVPQTPWMSRLGRAIAQWQPRLQRKRSRCRRSTELGATWATSQPVFFGSPGSVSY